MQTNDKRNYRTPQTVVFRVQTGNRLLQGSGDVSLIPGAIGGRGDFLDGGDPFALL